MEDLIAKKYRAYLYPFLELALGLGYISFWHPDMACLTTLTLTPISAFGVCLALRQGLDVQCACMGTALQVPLSTVALVEDFGMLTMAGLMLVLN